MIRWALAAGIVALATLVVGPEASGARPRAPLQFPGAYRTLQATVDAAVNGDTITIAPGVYNQQFVVSGKSVQINGAGDGRTVLQSSDRTVGIATYTNGGGGELSGVALQGGAYGIGSPPDPRSPAPAALLVHDVTVSGGYRGVYGAFSSLSLAQVTVHDTAWNGISVTGVTRLAVFVGVDIFKAGGDGFYVSNVGGGDVLVSGDFHDNAANGIFVAANSTNVHLIFVTADHNLNGLYVHAATVGVALSLLSNNSEPQPGGCEGTGLTADGGAHVTVGGTVFRDNCLSIAVGGANVDIANNRFSLTTADPTAEEGFSQAEDNDIPGYINNNGGNVCGDNLAAPGQLVIPCINWVFPSLEPPQMVAGLE